MPLTDDIKTVPGHVDDLREIVRKGLFREKNVYLAFDVEASGPADCAASRTLAVGVALMAAGDNIIYTASMPILPSNDEPEDFFPTVKQALTDLQLGAVSAEQLIADLEQRFYAFSDDAFVDKCGDSWKNFMLVRNLEMYLKLMLKAEPQMQVRYSLMELLTLLDTGGCASLRFVCDNPHFDFYFLRRLLSGAFAYDFVTYPIDTDAYAREQGREKAYSYTGWPPIRGGVIDPDSYCMIFDPEKKWVDTAQFFRDRGMEIYRAEGSLHMPEVDAENALRTFVALQMLINMK